MKTEINEKGRLKISAETAIEGYALKKWWDGHMAQENGNPDNHEESLQVEVEMEKDEKETKGFG